MSNISEIGGQVFDSRDAIQRIADLESTRDSLAEDVANAAEALAEAEAASLAGGLDPTLTAAQSDALANALVEALEALEAAKTAQTEWLEDADEATELKALEELRDECASGEWSYGLTFIREDYWIEYVEEMLKDIGDLPKEIPHYIVIDWQKTADNIAMDYSTLDFDGDTYYYHYC